MKSNTLKVLEYDVLFEKDTEQGGYTVNVPALPGCISEGDTLDEAKDNITEAILSYLESVSKDGIDINSLNQSYHIEKVSIKTDELLKVNDKNQEYKAE